MSALSASSFSLAMTIDCSAATSCFFAASSWRTFAT
jgi:hypothetical protein